MAKSKKKSVKKAAPKKAAPKKAAAKKSAPKKTMVKKAAPKKMAKVAKPMKKAAAVVAKPSPAKVKALLKPLDDRLVIQIQEMAKRTAGGLYIPDTADVSGNYQGTVLAVGQGHKNKKGKLRPMDVQAGDEVLFDQYAGSKLTLDGVEVLILRESEVLGIVETK